VQWRSNGAGSHGLSTSNAYFFASDDFGYLFEPGVPVPSNAAFDLDPVIKRERIWHGEAWRAALTLVDRISHSRELVRRLEHDEAVANNVLEKSLGYTVLAGQGKLDGPP